MRRSKRHYEELHGISSVRAEADGRAISKPGGQHLPRSEIGRQRSDRIPLQDLVVEAPSRDQDGMGADPVNRGEVHELSGEGVVKSDNDKATAKWNLFLAYITCYRCSS